MKVLFIGEGPHDIGQLGDDPNSPQKAAGVITVLARKVCPDIDEDSWALRWSRIVRFNPDAKKRRYHAKVSAAIVLSGRKYGCDGTICVADRDKDKNRLKEMEKGRESGLNSLGGPYPVVCGVAVESIEAWTLGSPE